MTEEKKNTINKIYIGEDQRKLFLDDLEKICHDKNVFILVDTNTEKHCLPTLITRAQFLNKARVIKIESGEINKTIETCSFVWDALTNSGAERDAIFINLGGGVICDMGGFIASTYKRGLNFINIPTTLLAMTDASIGGKTGVDFNGFKNQLGVYSTPEAICIFSEFLQSLEKRQLINGFAEVIKHALIFNNDYWEKIKKINLPECKNWDDIIEESVKLKSSVVEQDPFEKNIRKKLNFGHTIGHAVESWSLKHDLGPLLHGEAIAIGIICESYLSCKTNNLTESAFEEIINYIFKIFPKYDIPERALEEIIANMYQDKKNTGGNINFSLLSDIGKCEINKNCQPASIKESLQFYSAFN